MRPFTQSRSWLVVVALGALLGLAACAPELEPAAGGAAAGTIPVERPSAAPTAEPQPSPPGTPTPTPSPDYELSSEEATATGEAIRGTAPATPYTPTPVPPFPGMVYQDGGGLWRVDGQWQPALLTAHSDAVLDPLGRRFAYVEADDVWLELPGQPAVNLTENADQRHCCLRWWPGRPELILAGSLDPGEDDGPSTGRLVAVGLDGSNYIPIDSQASNSLPAGSPDGRVIAYDAAGAARLYDWESGPQPFDPLAYGLPEGVTVARIASPSWAPGGRFLAWIMAVEGGGYGQGGSSEVVTGVFDRATQTALLLHPYTPIGRGGWFDPVAWSPDGRWLAVVVESAGPSEAGLWLLAADGSEEQYLGPGRSPIWSPDGHYLAYREEEAADSRHFLLQNSSWYRINLYVPGRLVAWLNP